MRLDMLDQASIPRQLETRTGAIGWIEGTSKAASAGREIGIGVTEGFLSHFSNHWVVLLANVMENVVDHTVMFPIWSFGDGFESCTVANATLFADNYYGAVVAKLK